MGCSTTRRRRLTAATLAAIPLLAACGSDGDPVATSPAGDGTLPEVETTDPIAPPPTTGELGFQAAEPGDFDVAFRPGFAGTLAVDDRGCWSLRGNGEDVFIVLPVGTEPDPSGSAVITPDGAVIEAGTPVAANGALMNSDALPGGPDGRLATLAAFCRPGALNAVVSDVLTADDFDPTALDGEALAAMIEQADFAVDWPCGVGFTTGTADQRVALRFDPLDLGADLAGPVTLPDDRWAASVAVGKHLFVNHCDDVAEWFEPDRVVAATYPVIAGSFEYTPPEPGTDPSLEPVTIVVDGVVVDGPTGPIPLGTFTIVNERFGLIPG